MDCLLPNMQVISLFYFLLNIYKIEYQSFSDVTILVQLEGEKARASIDVSC